MLRMLTTLVAVALLMGLRVAEGEELCEPRAADRKDQPRAGLAAQTAMAEAPTTLPALDRLPPLGFDELLVLKRRRGQDGLPVNHMCNAGIPKDRYQNELAILSPVSPQGMLRTLFRPTDSSYVGEMDLHFDADRLLFTMPAEGQWNVHELRLDGSGLRRLTHMPAGVDSFDACYLPNGCIVFASTANCTAVPCWNGRQTACSLYSMDAQGGQVRQLSYDQDVSIHPTVLSDGRILYSRWDYTGLHHAYVRPLMTMNPDGSQQRAIYGSNSYWPNTQYFTHELPGAPLRLITIVSGYHGTNRSGELVLFDARRGAREAAGAVQKIPGKGRPIETPIRDNLMGKVWPRFLHPYPVDERSFLVACQPTEGASWGIYLADLDDHLTPVLVDEGFDFFEPVPVRKTPRPPVIPDRIDLQRRDAVVYLQDVYAGPGLAGVPRGTVKQLRIVAYEFGYPGLAGPDYIGHGGPWEALQILGTVPVAQDGSAAFRVPANMPLTIQALDGEGKAVQLMRSWYTAMPGESVGCVGCHESPHQSPAATSGTIRVTDIEPWYGPPRGFDFRAEVQPVLDRHCVGCHDGQPHAWGAGLPDLRRAELVPGYNGRRLDKMTVDRMHPEIRKALGERVASSPAYDALVRLIRRVNIDDEVHLLVAGHYHADTSELMQMLAKGHYGVKLDAESIDRLVTWIDLNGPFFGSWRDVARIPDDGDQRRRELARRFGPPGQDLALTSVLPGATIEPLLPAASLPTVRSASRSQAKSQESVALPSRTIRLTEGIELTLVRLPRSRFTMGDPAGSADEQPREASIEQAFWIGQCEITNEQFRLFAPRHDSGVFSKRFPPPRDPDGERRDGPGFALNDPKQPAVRVSYEQAAAYCQWLANRTGHRFGLPTEQQWEYACRAGSTSSHNYGTDDVDFSQWANLAGRELDGYWPDAMNSAAGGQPFPGVWDPRFQDPFVATAPAGSFQPNGWGLYDLHGNAAEWTSSDFDAARKTVRGGSFHDRPGRATAYTRWGYPPWQRVWNVGFRVVCANLDVSAEAPHRKRK